MNPDLREKYIARCEEWCRAARSRPSQPPQTPKTESKIDPDLFQKAFRKYGAVIPVPELFKIGYSKQEVDRVVAKRKWYNKHDAALAKEIERRWPGGKTKSKTVIKAVNKRLPFIIRNVREED
jgi:hypothetical protein